MTTRRGGSNFWKVGVVLLLSACSTDSVTYYQDVAPVLNKHCVQCHSSVGIASFALDTFEDAKTYARVAASAVRNRTMPPFNVDNSGACRTFTPARWLSDAEIEALDSWSNDPLAGNVVEGGGTANVADGFVATKTIQTPSYVPGPELDDYRCFIVDPELENDAFLTAIQVQPSAPQVAHHLLMFTLDSEEAETFAREQDAKSEKTGFPCLGNIGNSLLTREDVRLANVWAPGVGIAALPEGTGIRLRKGHKLVMQVHHNLAGGSSANVMDIGLALQPSVPQEGYVALIDDFDLELPAGLTEATYTWNMPVDAIRIFYNVGGDQNLRVRGVFPHMHELGLQQTLHYVDDDVDTCMYSVPRWDFGWQEFFFYPESQQQVLRHGNLRLSCTYDTSQRDSPLEWGEGTQDEMCMTFLYYTIEPADNP